MVEGKQNYTFKEMAYEALKELGKMSNSREIWGICEHRKLYTGEGKTPWNTISSQLYTDIINNPETLFYRTVEEDGLFGLREWQSEADLKVFDEWRAAKRRALEDGKKKDEKAVKSSSEIDRVTKSAQSKRQSMLKDDTEDNSLVAKMIINDVFESNTSTLLEDFEQRRKTFLDRINKVVARSATMIEEQTKQSLIMPFLSALGYDIYDPDEIEPEYTADVATKKGEKVDYAIYDSKHKIRCIVECKKAGTILSEEHRGQLFRYYSIVRCPLAILTNGLDYYLYSDFDENNVLDVEPFAKFNILTESNLLFYMIFMSKSYFDIENLGGFQDKQHMNSEIAKFIRTNIEDPSDAFVRFVMKSISIKASTRNMATSKTLISLALKSVVTSSNSMWITSDIKTGIEDVAKLITSTIDGSTIIKTSKPFGMELSIYMDNDKLFGRVSIHKEGTVVIFDKTVQLPDIGYERFEYTSIAEFKNALSLMLK